jgi:hypothetical protein
MWEWRKRKSNVHSGQALPLEQAMKVLLKNERKRSNEEAHSANYLNREVYVTTICTTIFHGNLESLTWTNVTWRPM